MAKQKSCEYGILDKDMKETYDIFKESGFSEEEFEAIMLLWFKERIRDFMGAYSPSPLPSPIAYRILETEEFLRMYGGEKVFDEDDAIAKKLKDMEESEAINVFHPFFYDESGVPKFVAVKLPEEEIRLNAKKVFEENIENLPIQVKRAFEALVSL